MKASGLPVRTWLCQTRNSPDQFNCPHRLLRARRGTLAKRSHQPWAGNSPDWYFRRGRPELSTSILQAFLRTNPGITFRACGRRCLAGNHLRTWYPPNKPARLGSGQCQPERRRVWRRTDGLARGGPNKRRRRIAGALGLRRKESKYRGSPYGAWPPAYEAGAATEAVLEVPRVSEHIPEIEAPMVQEPSRAPIVQELGEDPGQ